MIRTHIPSPPLARLAAAGLALVGVLAAALPAGAALTDLSQAPLASSASTVVKPNVSFVLDASGSMAWTHAPDEAQPFFDNVGYKSSQCNSIYYRPDILYVAPKHSDGTDFPNASFTGAWNDGYNTANGTTNLSTSFFAYTSLTSNGAGTDTAQPAYYYVYKGSAPVNFQNTSSQFYQECSANESPTPSAKITFSGSNSTSVNSITVNGVNIMAASTAASTSSTTLASLTAAQINASGFSATASGSSVTIVGPVSVAGVVPVITTTPPLPTSTVTFSGTSSTITTGITVNGTQIMSGATAATTSSSTMATNVASKITLSSFSAAASGSAVTITGPASASGFTPLVTTSAGSSTATITVSGNSTTQVTGITVNGTQIMSGSASSSNKSNTVASNVAAKITINGYAASSSGSVITITGPATAVGFNPIVTSSGSMTFSTTAFAASGGAMTASATTFTRSAAMSVTIQAFSPFEKVIVSATSGPGGTDERQNFANWFSYYRTRILMMKSGAGRAFASIGSSYRVGFMTIQTTPSSSTSDPNYLAINDFDQTQKNTFYTKFYAEVPNNATPLKKALSTAGLNIAGKLGPDPVQYSCQQNFIILTTDGYWNAGSANGVQLNGSTAVGNQDNNPTATPRPMYDGGLTNSVNTLADVAAYYYNTDLRTTACNSGPSGADVCQNNVPTSTQDPASWQHVTLFTLGLGVNGQLQFASDYLTGGSADFNAITSGAKDWPSPTGDTLTTIDDLWHAAVNGHGEYFSAKNPDLLVSGLRTALAGVSAREAAGAAAATSNLEPVAGDNAAFVANFRTVKWDGDVQSRPIDLSTGAISNTVTWSAQAQLDAQVNAASDSRTIFTFLSGQQVSFTPGSFSSAQKAAWFTPTTAPALSQSSGWTAVQSAAATPDTLINYLRGQFGFEERSPANTTLLYRTREHVLGDIIDGKPVFAKAPPFNYTDPGYSAFKTAVSGRQGVVYVAANDGMLHAFNSDTGSELWAYVPSFVLPNLKALADDNYPNAHQYYVDGSPIVSDIFTGSSWKTILVGGLNGGGKGYYALDVTDPSTPVVLWEYSDTNLGFTFGDPVIGKLTDGTWVVVFGSGYNNTPTATNTSADGVGRLYVLDASTGALKFTISTGVGTAASPAGLAKVSSWVDNGLIDNTIARVYGGDLLGNLWRFDVDDIIAPTGKEATKLAFFQVGTSFQPITTTPELGTLNNRPIVYVGTGRYLGVSDVNDTSQQSLYAIVDQMNATGIGNARTETSCPLVQQSLTIINSTTRSTSTLPVDFASKCGWFIDFNPANASPGERVNIDPKLQLGILAVATNIPQNSVCTVGGSSFLYFFDYSTGTFVATSSGQVAGQMIGNSIAVGLNTYRLPDGRVVTTVTKADATYPGFGNPPSTNLVNAGKRVMYRELLN